MPPSKRVEPGTRMQDFVFIRYTPTRHGSAWGVFRCVRCGEERERTVSHVRTGYVKSCHCTNKTRAIRHGHASTGAETTTYQAWASMKKRCLNPTHASFSDYGGRGITVCSRWLESFENFLADMGECPDGLSLERGDNDKGYSQENCRWATLMEQNSNRRSNTWITFNGKTLTVTQWARELGMKKNTLIERFRRGQSAESALTTPVQKRVAHANVPPQRS